MFSYRKALLIFALILLLDNCSASKSDNNGNSIFPCRQKKKKNLTDNLIEKFSKNTQTDTPCIEKEKEMLKFETEIDEQQIKRSRKEMQCKTEKSLRKSSTKSENGENIKQVTAMMDQFCKVLDVKKSTKFELLKKLRHSVQENFENIDDEIEEEIQYYEVVEISPDLEILYSDEIKQYFYIICAHMVELFGEESLELERHDRIFKAAETYSNLFSQYVKEDTWKCKNKKLVSDDVWKRVEDDCDKNLSKKEKENFIKLKQLILTKILDYYGEVAQTQEVDVVTQAWILLIVKRPEKWWQWRNWKSECDLPHRRPAQAEEGYVTMYTPNPKAVVLAAGSFLIQIMVPLTMIIYHFLGHKNNYVLNGWKYGEFSHIINKLCPVSIFTDMHYGEISSSELYYLYVTKFATLTLSYYLNGILKADLEKSMEIFSKNWTSKALSVRGLIVSRIQNVFSYVLVLLTTVVLFFQSSDLPDILLNCIAMSFIISFHRDFSETHKVKHGIATINDGGRKILLSYIASGARDTGGIDENMASKKIEKLIYFLGILISLGYVWVFNCV